MATNVEIKAKVRDREALLQRIQEASEDTPVLLRQEDTFFRSAKGRLKLRVLAPDQGQLVYYERGDQAGPKPSHYLLVDTDQPERLRAALASALGIRGVVRKERWLYTVDQTRIHLDVVEGLGCFVELEVVLSSCQGEADGRRVALALMERLGIPEDDLVSVSYVDLLEQSATPDMPNSHGVQMWGD